MSLVNSSRISDDLPQQVVAALRTVCGESGVALHAPRFKGSEWKYLRDSLDSTFVSSVGAYVDRFEADLAKYTGAKHVVAVVNGTAALHVALLLAGVQPGDEVLVPALTFVATANAVRYCAATPHFVDSNEATLGIDPDSLRDWLVQMTEQREGLCVNRETGKIIRVLLPMHTFGHPCAMDALQTVASDFGLIVVEDAAESLGSWYGERHTGTIGRIGTLSFNGNKIITTGGGGAILTNDTALARRAKHLTTTAKLQHRWEYEHDEVGFNYRMPNLNAALGCAQLELMPEFLASKRRLYQRYREVFFGIAGIRLVGEPAHTQSNFWLQALLLDQARAGQRDAILTATNDVGYMTRPAWRLLHQMTPYWNCPRAPLSVAESLVQRLINIPSSADIA